MLHNKRVVATTCNHCNGAHVKLAKPNCFVSTISIVVISRLPQTRPTKHHVPGYAEITFM
eukprot:4257748-Amphidinium_carterae.1